jgi:hypothetical protein
VTLASSICFAILDYLAVRLAFLVYILCPAHYMPTEFLAISMVEDLLSKMGDYCASQIQRWTIIVLVKYFSLWVEPEGSLPCT